MRWGDIKVITIQKLFLVDKFDYKTLISNSFDEDVKIYLDKMMYAANEGLQRIYTYGYPKFINIDGVNTRVKAEQITEDTTDEYKMQTYDEALVLLPMYIASQIYKDDDIGLATGYRNEFEVGLQELKRNKTDEIKQIKTVYEMGV